ncbi:MAG: tetratricopeptide repeat protein [Gammaproteobacteria bacterium]|nr:tetratricopeptide repeat protein [Gammaproteobacteria bacterium]
MRSDWEESFRRQISLPDDNVDLLRAALLIGADEYLNLDVAHHVATLDAWAQEIGGRVAPGTDEQIRIRQLNKFLFGELGFSGNTGEYYDPRNSYINEVLERRRGIPISLSLVYMELGRRLGLDLVGVSFPGHFLVKLPYGDGEVVIDPYNRGISLSAEDLTNRLRGVFDVDIESPAPFLAAASNKHILIRMLANLKGIYQQQGKATKIIAIITKILLVDPDRVSEYRERGLMFNALECYNAALKDLQYYLNHAPDDEDTGDVRQLVFRLQEHHSRLN